jgi:hypothetical protein
MGVFQSPKYPQIGLALVKFPWILTEAKPAVKLGFLGILRISLNLLGRKAGGGRRIRTFELIRGQIYSLLPLTARPSLR